MMGDGLRTPADTLYSSALVRVVPDEDSPCDVTDDRLTQLYRTYCPAIHVLAKCCWFDRWR